MEKTTFYSAGLKFSCTRCSACCRYESGFVFLSEGDTGFLVKKLNMGYSEFVDTYCRWVPAGAGQEQLSLKEKPGYDCIFWDKGCSVYDARPVQCRTFPFWPSILSSEETWRETALSCPGMNRGTLHGPGQIEASLDERRQEPVIVRQAGGRP